jgi:hypothetical protein
MDTNNVHKILISREKDVSRGKKPQSDGIYGDWAMRQGPSIPVPLGIAAQPPPRVTKLSVDPKLGVQNKELLILVAQLKKELTGVKAENVSLKQELFKLQNIINQMEASGISLSAFLNVAPNASDEEAKRNIFKKLLDKNLKLREELKQL